jgi:2,4-dienoyl-CoA reductase-like NADH-dependent reductase (Old Yellow Enzyme family)
MPCSISATEWLEYLDEPSWTLEDTKRFTSILAAHGVDLVDISSGGNTTKQKISFLQSASSQADFSATVRSHVITEGVTVKGTEAPLLVTAVGGISTGELANSILEEGKADAIFVGRYFQQNPGLVWEFARQLDVTIHNAHQIGWSFLSVPLASSVEDAAGPVCTTQSRYAEKRAMFSCRRSHIVICAI